MYLDHAATTPLDPRVRETMEPYWSERFGNPSSEHAYGQMARRAVEAAREQVAALISARSEEIVFTSGGTESDNLALRGTVRPERGEHLIVSAVEHHAVLHVAEELAAEGCRLTVLPVDREGLVDPDDVRRALGPTTVLVSVMLGQNEVGTLEPLAEIARLTREAGVLLHTDAVAAVGQVPVSVETLGVDLLSLSGHKFYGPKGTGALFVRSGVRLRPTLAGGGQERGRRSGTENVPGVVGLGQAAEQARVEGEERRQRVAGLRDRLWRQIQGIPGCELNGPQAPRLPGNLNFSFPDLSATTLLSGLNLRGVAAAAGSACAVATVSHVLSAMGLAPKRARGALRFSLGAGNTKAEVDEAVGVLREVVTEARRYG